MTTIREMLIPTGTTVSFDSGQDIIHRIEGQQMLRAKAEGFGVVRNSFGNPEPGWGPVRYEVECDHGTYLIDSSHVLEIRGHAA